jgi:hypothetical protein
MMRIHRSIAKALYYIFMSATLLSAGTIALWLVGRSGSSTIVHIRRRTQIPIYTYNASIFPMPVALSIDHLVLVASHKIARFLQ